MIYGYARVSTVDQDNSIQVKALASVGCHKIIQEKMSGVKLRPELERLLKRVKSGDTIYVYKLDRLARSMTHFLKIFEHCRAAGVKVLSIQESINPDTPQGRFFIQMLGVFAEFEHQTIRERCMAGQMAARARGQTWGNKPALSDSEAKQAAAAWRSGWWQQKTLADALGINKSTLVSNIHRVENRGRFTTKNLLK